MSKVLVIADTHLPATYPTYLTFCKDMYKEWKCNKVVHIGDVFDWAALGFWQTNPDLPSAEDEHALCVNFIKPWVKAFPKMHICIGNHDARLYRKAFAAGIPVRHLPTYNKLTGTPRGWKWVRSVDIDDVHYTHGTGRGGSYPAVNKSRWEGRSVVVGHVHHACGIQWSFSGHTGFFGMSVGAGVDDKHACFDYATENDKKSALGVGIVWNGQPYWERMPCGDGEPYHRSKA